MRAFMEENVTAIRRLFYDTDEACSTELDRFAFSRKLPRFIVNTTINNFIRQRKTDEGVKDDPSW